MREAERNLVKNGAYFHFPACKAESRVGLLVTSDEMFKTPVWHWFLGRYGSPEWLVSIHKEEAGSPFNKDFPQIRWWDRSGKNPGAQLHTLVEELPDVDCLVIQGSPPAELWAVSENFEAIMWLEGRGGVERSRKRKLRNAQDRENYSWRLSHSYLGGCSDFEVRLHVSVVVDSWSGNMLPKAGVPSVLGACCCSTHGGRFVDEPSNPPFRNTAKGLIDWKRRFERVTVPTVFNKTHWVRRKLDPHELCAVLDFPLDKLKKLSIRQKEQAAKVPVPGKVLAEAFRLWDQGMKNTAQLMEITENLDQAVEPGSEGSPRKKPRNEPGYVRQPIAEPVMRATSGETVQPAETKDTVSGKATKADGAKVPVHLWDNRVRGYINKNATEEEFQRALKTVRWRLLERWRNNVKKGFEKWLGDKRKNGTKIDPRWTAMGYKALRHTQKASWWNWDGGSGLFFWRWPWQQFYLIDYVLGPPVRFSDDPPNDMTPQPPYDDASVKEKVRAKVQAVIEKKYIEIVPEAQIKSCMYMFDVPKGEEDIRMVYDGSKSGLNAALTSLWFTLPTVDSISRSMEAGTWCADNDYGEMFLNFPIHPELQMFCGVDLTQLFPEEARRNGGRLFGRWTRLAMGLKPSPQGATMGSTRAKFFILGNNEDENNPFQWAEVKLNLPGAPGYDPRKPWIAKYRKDGRLASDAEDYIDDIRLNSASEELAWQASSCWAKKCAWLGLQDAARKRREPSQTPGAWAGTVLRATKHGIQKSVLPERWSKTRRIIQWFGKHVGLLSASDQEMCDIPKDEPEIALPEGHLPFKQAERYRGFLIYVARTFGSMTPYLKGIHLTLDSWRTNRDEDGWRLAGNARDKDLGLQDVYPASAPRTVKMVNRLKEDIRALMQFTEGREPPWLDLRPTRTHAVYLVGDASGSGFGTSSWDEVNNEVDVNHGSWTKYTATSSSNFREAVNLVMRLELLLSEGKLARGTEIFVFTDNFVTENAFFKGTSKSKKLHNLMVRLRKMEMEGHIFVHCIWIAGTRMIEQGTDGLSRGDFTSGVMTGKDFLDFIPLNETAMERSGELVRWIRSTLPKETRWLSCADWFKHDKMHPLDICVWSPPPCIADVALELMCRTKQAHPHSIHVFLCPELMTSRWRKKLGKAADVLLKVPLTSTIWPKKMHESLYIGLTFATLNSRPWTVKQLPESRAFVQEMSSMWGVDMQEGRDCLRKFWYKAESLSLRRSLARRVLSGTQERPIPKADSN